ncbi:MAG TPA: hypothetical protein VGN15_09145, partial [Ktedonobacteraceae bacterium]|nr:hypothetical protein [Ktedonobacteraceae bacterium]
GLFCSTLLKRPPVSTAIAYMFCVIWVATPWALAALLNLSSPINGGSQPSHIFLGNPILAMISTLDFGGGISFGSFAFFKFHASPWISYIVVNLLLTLILILLSMWLVKPNPIGRLSRRVEKRLPKSKKVVTTEV